MKKAPPIWHLARSICTASLLCMLIAPSALSSDYSARIRALGGGHVAGIIPDTLTDIFINPAYLSLMKRKNVILEINSDYPQHQYYPNFSWIPYYFMRTFNAKRIMINALDLRSWKAAISAKWNMDESQKFYPETEQYVYPSHIDYSSRKENNSEAHDLWNIDLMLSHFLGRSRIIGIRLCVNDIYAKDDHEATELSEYFDFPLAHTNLPYNENKHMDRRESIRREFNPSLQLSMSKMKGGKIKREFSLSFSKNNIYRHFLYERCNSHTEYNTDIGYVTDHSYTDEENYEKKKGDIYSVSFQGREFTDSGVILFSGLNLSAGSYDSYWNNYYESYEYEISETIDNTRYSCMGDYRSFSAFIKGGKTFGLIKTLSVTTGAYAYFKKEWTGEKPVITYSYNHLDPPDTVDLKNNTLHKISSDYIYANFSCPVSFEFKPVRYFSLYAAFVAQFIYEREKKEFNEPQLTMNIDNIQLLEYEIKGDDEKYMQDYTYITAGFAFKIGDKAAIDFYTRGGIDFRYLADAAVDFMFKF